MQVPLKQGLKQILKHRIENIWWCLNASSIKTRIETAYDGDFYPLRTLGLNASSIKTRIETKYNKNPLEFYYGLNASSIKTRIETKLSRGDMY